jgi:hypothetical protein
VVEVSPKDVSPKGEALRGCDDMIALLLACSAAERPITFFTDEL